jgi:GrpB-like predicted nucleotidyltransferase (UPF0157 family)
VPSSPPPAGHRGHSSLPPVERRGLVGRREPVTIVLREHDPAWAQRFAIERQKIHAALGDRALVVEHIGSTSVVGLAAKPIVDICLAVPDSSDEAAYVPDLEALGYSIRVREPDWHEHRMLRTAARDVHLHVFTAGSGEIERHLLFRDRLRRDSADRALYESTKRVLAQQEWESMDDYATAKGDVVEEILARARAPGPTGRRVGDRRALAVRRGPAAPPATSAPGRGSSP